MSTVDSTFLIVAASLISLFFLLLSGLVIYVWVSYRHVIRKAEAALDTVESATHMIKEVGNKTNAVTIFKVIKFLTKLSRRG